MATRNKRRSVIVKKKKELDIDITSLLDILVILLVFLLKSYNASDLKLDLVKNLVVPNSKARTLGNHAIIVQVDADKTMYVNKKKIGKISNSGEHMNLLAELKGIKENARTPAQKKAKAVNLKSKQKGAIGRLQALNKIKEQQDRDNEQQSALDKIKEFTSYSPS